MATHYTSDGLTAYDVLRIKNCPLRPLPFARSMTQARIDYEQRQDSIIEWYELNKGLIKAIGDTLVYST